MHEQGVVTRIVSPQVVEVSFPAAEGCAACGICRLSGAGAASIEAKNAVGAKAGDAVEVEIATGGVLQSSAIVYLLPVFSLLAGYAVGSSLALWVPVLSGEAGGIAGSVTLFAVSFLIVRWHDRRVARENAVQATVTGILTPDSPSQGNGPEVKG